MNYKEANEKLQGRNKQSRKLANNTYLVRRESLHAIALRLHNTDVLTFHSTGKITVANGGFPTVTTHDRINNFLPKGFRVFGEPVETRRTNGNGMTILRKYNPSEGPRNSKQVTEVLVDNRAEISKGGKLTGGNVAKYRADRKAERAEEMRPINRGRYWLRKLEGIHTDKSGCITKDPSAMVPDVYYQSEKGKMRPVQKWDCSLYGRSGRRNLVLPDGQTEHVLDCGCKVFYRIPSADGLTVQGILNEENATVKAAMLKIYGLERFFQDANPTVLETLGDYSLIEIDTTPKSVKDRMGDGTFARIPDWQRTSLRALKMVCPSTGNVHIHAVNPREVRTISEALDWIFQLPEGVHYIDSIGVQS